MEQSKYRMPATGESWRHYRQNPGLYTVVGMSADAETGEPLVVYAPYRWSLAQLPPLYTRKLSSWLQIIDTGYDEMKAARGDTAHRFVPRFRFEREVGDDDKCPFIRSPTGEG